MKTQTVEIESFRHPVRTLGEIRIEYWDEKQRTKRALKSLGISWGIAIVCVFIPGLHFVLVPIFVLAGPFAFLFARNQESAILGGQGICPACQRALQIACSVNQLPRSSLCIHCHENLRLHAVSAI